MSWEATGLSLATAAAKFGLSKGVNAIIGLIFGLDASLADAIKQIEINTKRAILEARKTELEATYNGLVMSLNEYINVPIEADLTEVHSQVNNLVSQAEILTGIDPKFPGLAGHPLYMVSATLKIAVSQERMKIYKNHYEGEKKNLTSFLFRAINHANDMHLSWREWVNSRFEPLKYWYSDSEYLDIWYKFDGNYYGAGSLPQTEYLSGYYDPMYEVIENWGEAVKKRQDHIDSEMKIIEDNFINPSEKILVQWENLSKFLEMNLDILMTVIKYLSEIRLTAIGYPLK